MIDICSLISCLISCLITEEEKVWPVSIRGGTGDGSFLVQNMALLLKVDERSTNCFENK
jgi:hypothetical protein